MQRRVGEMKGSRLRATNGTIGRFKEVYFNDEQWTVKYLVANTAAWLHGWDVLIRPLAVRQIHPSAERVIEVNLTKVQVESSPPVEEDPPVSQQHESQYHRYPNWPYEWHSPALSRAWPRPILGYHCGPARAGSNGLAPARDPHLQSSDMVTGYDVQAHGANAGQVRDFIFDDASWRISYLVVGTRRWWPDKQVLVPPVWVASVSWSRSTVRVNLEDTIIAGAPKCDPGVPISVDYEAKVQDYYAKQASWEYDLAA